MRLKNGRLLDGQHTPYIVAEVNSSHGGSMETAKRMIEAAAECGCDCVKFQSWSAGTLYSKTYYKENPIAKRFVTKFSLSEEQLSELAVYCSTCGVDFSSTPYSRKEVDFLTGHAPYIKVASMDLNNLEFLAYIARTRIPIVLSTGMGTMEEIQRAVGVIRQAEGMELCLLHCISLYPSKANLIRLNNISGLRKMFPDCLVGFSDHSAGTELAAAAVALGACLIEKHLTLDKSRIGMDNQMAMEPSELKQLVAQCRRVYEAMGTEERVVSLDEMTQRTKMRRSVVYTRDMKKGETIRAEDLDVKRPGTGVPPGQLRQYIGRRMVKDVEGDTLLREADVQ